MIRWKDYKTKYVFPYAGVYNFRKEILKSDDLKILKIAKFSNRSYYIINNFEIYLKKVYGNFMDLPNESKRIPKHGFIKVEIGEKSGEKYD
jgi:lipopolysaccharide cholinephosphotransferase